MALLPNESGAPRISQFAMSQFDSNKDYYGVLGVDKDASQVEIDRQYKREAAKHHPDRGGSEERMKSLNEAYGVLKDQSLRSSYDEVRRPRPRVAAQGGFVPVTSPTARDVGVLGHCLSAMLCLIGGVFLLLLVRFQWFWFLWPLVILALMILGFGVMLARSAMVAVNDSLPISNRLKRHTRLQEAAFWVVIVSGAYGLYVVMTL
jgi:DnaJ-like protein